MPPKRMTANPVRPARYRAGKPLPGDRSESSGDEDDEEDEDEQQAAAPVQEEAPRQAGRIISTGLARVDLNQRFQKTSDDERTSDEEEEDEQDEEETADEDEDEKPSTRPAPSGDYASEDSDSDSDDSSEDEAPKRKLIRPTFIPKSKRNVQSAVAVAAATTDPTATSEVAAAQRKAEAHDLVETAIRREAIEKNAKKQQLDSDMTYTEPPDDTDDLDPAAERAAWKLRELLRIKRERDAIEKMEKEREEIEQRRNMDADERLKQDMEYVAKQRQEANEKKGKMGFMQKFYHKGAFYQNDESEVMNRDYATARLEDEVVNREVLPKALQVRSYDQLGKRGQTKWTHLAAEDTTNLGKDDGYGWAAAGKKKGKFQDIPGMRDERYMSDKMRERRDRERDGGGGGGERRDRDGGDGRREERKDDRRDDRRDAGSDTYRPSGGDFKNGRRDRDGDDYRRRDGSRERRRDRSRSPRRDHYSGRDDSRRDGRRSDHDRDGRRDDRGSSSFKSRWDQQDKPDRKRGGDDVQLDEKRRKIEA